jgi:predicted TIM-barrel fold metal-dependent hydrolase
MEAKCLTNDPVAETEWLHRIAEANGLPNAIIGQASFCQGDIDAVLVDQAAYPLIRSSDKAVAGIPDETTRVRTRHDK